MTKSNGSIGKVKELLTQEIISLRNLEKSTGYSRTALSQVLSGKYAGDTDRVEDALGRWLCAYEHRHSLADISTFDAVQLVCKMSWEYRELAVIYGNAGVGKTESAKYYAETNADHAAYVKMDVTLNMPELVSSILQALGETITTGSLRFRMNEIIKVLKMRNWLIIIDEADLLKYRQLEMLRAIYDDGNCGMVLIGLERIIRLMTRGESMKENLAQLYSRVGFKRKVIQPTTEDIRKIVHLRGLALSPPAIKQVQEWITGAGELRMVTKLLDRAEMLAAAESKAFDESYLKQAYSLLLGS